MLQSAQGKCSREGAGGRHADPLISRGVQHWATVFAVNFHGGEIFADEGRPRINIKRANL